MYKVKKIVPKYSVELKCNLQCSNRITAFLFFRFCLLGTSCDMITLKNSGSQWQCQMQPWLNSKTSGIYDILKPEVDSKTLILQCSGSQENMVSNSDMSRYTIERENS